MKRVTTTLFILLLIGLVADAWAGPIEELAQISGPRVQALENGNVDAYVAAYADNAVFHSALSAFRIEGKEAIRAYFAQLFQLYPKRRVLPRQPTARAYNDNVVIQNGYALLYLTDQKGNIRTVHTRSSVTWVNAEGRWQIVDQHNARLPMRH